MDPKIPKAPRGVPVREVREIAKDHARIAKDTEPPATDDAAAEAAPGFPPDEGPVAPGDDAGPETPTRPDAGSVPYRKLFRWGWVVVSAALGWFVVNTALGLLVQALLQYNVQVLAAVVSGLSAATSGGTGAGAAGPDGFLSRILPQDVQTAAVLFTSIALILVVLQIVDRALTSWTDTTMLGRLQQRLHDKLLTLGPAYHQQHDLSETTLIVTRYAAGTQQLLRDLISFPVVRGVTLTLAIVFLVGNMQAIGDTPLWLRGLLLSAVFILPIGGWWLSRNVRVAFGRVREAETAMAREFTNSAQLPLEVQLMGAQLQRSQTFSRQVTNFIRHRVAATIRLELVNQFQSTTPLLLQTGFLIYGVFFALRSGDPAAAGPILAIFYFVPQAVAPIQDILQFFMGMNSAWPQVQQVVEVLEATPEVEEQRGAQPLAGATGDVRLEKVTFSFDPAGPRIVDDLTFAFAPGKVTAIVARAGMGKSTLLNLVARVRDPDEGTILIAGRDLRAATLKSLRETVVKVSQFPLLLADTMRANLTLGWPSATDRDLESVCRRTGLWDVLTKAAGPGREPLDCVLPRSPGEGLSGGERRLLAVTRGLLRKPAVLLLDEPTTGIDAIGRAMLADVLADACRGMTVLLVDHDMDFVMRVADVVCCLEHGRFTAVGSPQELASQPTLFSRLLEASEHEEAEPEPMMAAHAHRLDTDMKGLKE
jgi:ABC-type multidrug transport system fused ATPase/permease subunit